MKKKQTPPQAKVMSPTQREQARRQKALQLAMQRDYTLLEPYCRELLERNTEHEFAHTNLAVVESSRGQTHKAVEHARSAIQANPEYGIAHCNLAMYLCELRRWGEAKAAAKRATELLPDAANAWLNLSWACNSLSHFTEAEAAARRALALSPNMIKAMNNLASSLKEQSRPAEAVDLYRKILNLDPGFSLSMGNLLLALQYDDRASTLEIAETSKAAGQLLLKEAGGQRLPYQGSSDPHRKIRIGFISPDLCDHAVMYFLEPLVCHLDRNRFEVHAFFMYAEGDAITKRFLRFVDRFHVLGGMKPLQQAQRVSDTQIDVLVDLAGHTAKTGLPAMAYKPAPVQVTWLGYPGTTGLETIDLRITDPIADQHHTPAEYTERLHMVQGPFCVYRPMIRYPLRRYWTEYAVRATPALAKGHVTFGSCNNVAKLSHQTLMLWARLLARVPNSKLLIEGKALADPVVAAAFRDKCAEAGLDNERVTLVQRDTARQYLTYHDIDIALDPFPLTGGTTTADVLWCGVPMVTMNGASFRARMSTSFLHAIGRPEWIAQDETHYLEIAAGLAADVVRLNRTRLSQRQRVERSPLMDEAGFARQFGQALQDAWLQWCAQQGTPPKPAVPAVTNQHPRVFISPGQSADREVVYQDINSALAQKDWPRVEQLATLTLETLPQDHGALAALAESQWAQSQPQRAIDYLRNAINLAPGALNYYDRLAFWLTQLGKAENAEQVKQAKQRRMQNASNPGGASA